MTARQPVILGVMSDTHGNRALMFRVADALIHTHHAEAIFHLGDDYADVEELRNAGYPVHGVPGLWCREYHNPRVPNTLIENLNGWVVAGAHAAQDIRGAAARAQIILTGHTHEAELRVVRRSLRVNPGHLKDAVNRGQPASYAVLVLDGDAVRASVHELSGAVRQELLVQREDLQA